MPDLVDLFPGFASHWIDVRMGRVFARAGGSGPPVVLLHGFPQTHVCWHRVAPELAKSHFVVCMDLRGYGWSSAPASEGGALYAKRAMAEDVIEVMAKLGHVRFALVGHDRGARIGYRLALDHPGRLERLALLDIEPTYRVWQEMRADPNVAPHWVFLAKPAPEPEDEIGKDPIGYADRLLALWSRGKSLSCFDPRALAYYHASANEPTRIRAYCEDYRAGATLDLAADEADLSTKRKILCPVLVLAGTSYLKGGEKAALATWHESFAPHAVSAGVASGHFLAEEAPEATATALSHFLAMG